MAIAGFAAGLFVLAAQLVLYALVGEPRLDFLSAILVFPGLERALITPLGLNNLTAVWILLAPQWGETWPLKAA